jgi:prevent-host-death family protein
MTMVTKGPKMAETHEIPAGRFKAICLKLMDEVAATGREVVITKRGKPVARLMPMGEENTGSKERGPLIGSMRHLFEIRGDVVGPLPERWYRMSESDPLLQSDESDAHPPASGKRKAKKGVGRQ